MPEFRLIPRGAETGSAYLTGKKGLVLRNFSRYARLYDKYANIQNLAAGELLDMSRAGAVGNILELGCGTGGYTRLLRQRYAGADITAVDISRNMAAQARLKLKDAHVKFIVTDAEEFSPGRGFDLITSNASFQWFDNLGQTLKKCALAISEKGLLLFSIFGPSTFRELGESLRIVLGEGVSMSADGFPRRERLETFLKRGFKSVAIRELILKERYPSLLELLRKIKYTGAAGGGAGGVLLWKRRALDKVEAVYKERFGSIVATHQLFLCRAE